MLLADGLDSWLFHLLLFVLFLFVRLSVFSCLSLVFVCCAAAAICPLISFN